MQDVDRQIPGLASEAASMSVTAPGVDGTQPLLSVVICTHDRPLDVSDCLLALMPQLAGSSTKVIIADSASSPDKQQLLEKVVARHPAVRLIRVEETGSSLARNVGIAATSSEWVAFLDDDAVPAPDWHEQLLRVLAQVPADCGAIGGQILPIFPVGSAPELGGRWKMYVSLNDAGGERDCTEHFGLISANCAFRRRALDEACGFPTDLGRFGKSLLSGEDVLLMRRVRSHGWRLRYHSQFSVGHKVSSERLTRRWVRARALWEGVTTVRMARIEHDRSWIRLAVKAGAGLPVVGLGALLSPRDEWDLRWCFNAGVMLEALGLLPSAKAPGRKDAGARQPTMRRVLDA